MKLIFIFLTTLSIINICTAQVSNDDCAHAQVLKINQNTNGICFNGMVADTGIYTSNINSIPNYPYPTNPNPCEGYISSIASPANDIWYVVNPTGIFSILLSSSDTTHISFWIGNCSTLLPYKCYTLNGNDFINETFQDIQCYPNYHLYIQISGNKVGKLTTFGACLWDRDIIGCYSDTIKISTPVLCFDYDIRHLDESSPQANDGSAIINIKEGNKPYTFQWNDGNTDSIRTNLSIGKYYVTITDKNGCSEKDSVNIEVITNTNDQSKSPNIEITPTPSSDFIKLSSNLDILKSKYEIIDLKGQLLKSEKIQNNRQIIDISHLSKGIYFIKIIYDKQIDVKKIIKN